MDVQGAYKFFIFLPSAHFCTSMELLSALFDERALLLPPGKVFYHIFVEWCYFVDSWKTDVLNNKIPLFANVNGLQLMSISNVLKNVLKWIDTQFGCLTGLGIEEYIDTKIETCNDAYSFIKNLKRVCKPLNVAEFPITSLTDLFTEYVNNYCVFTSWPDGNCLGCQEANESNTLFSKCTNTNAHKGYQGCLEECEGCFYGMENQLAHSCLEYL